jgi:hypothetical protein
MDSWEPMASNPNVKAGCHLSLRKFLLGMKIVQLLTTHTRKAKSKWA